MAKKKKEVSTKKTAGKSAVKSVKKATTKKTATSAKAKAGKAAKSKKTSVVKKATKTSKTSRPALKAKPARKVAPKKAATAKKAKPVVKKAKAAKKPVAVKKKATVKKAAAKKVSTSKTKTAKTVKKTIAKKKPVVAKKATVVKKVTAVKKTSTSAKATADKARSVKATADKPAKPAANGTTKTSIVKKFALTSSADLTTEKEKEAAKINTPEPSWENETTTPAAAVKTQVKVAEPKKKEIKHTISDPSLDPVKHLADVAVEGILEVKGRNISVLNLKNIHNRVCDYFIICQADSNTQVNAIAGSVEEMVKKMTGERPYRKEGFENAEWILVDYVTVVVHIFQSEVRNFYNLESLWADAEVTELAFD